MASRRLRCVRGSFTISSSCMSRLVARGKYLFEGDRKYFARGVSYGPFAPNSQGERYPERDRARADFALMRKLGANVLRLYVTPPEWLVEEAAAAGLRLMVGFPWPFHMAFLDSPDMTREIRETIRAGVTSLRKFGDAILAYSLGNEIRADIVRWHGPSAVSSFLADLYDIGKQADPEGLFTYSNYPSTEYLDLSFLDIVSFNVYLHKESDYRRYLTHLLAVSADRPLMLTETGMDTIREGEGHQAELLAWQARAAFELGLSGFIVFAFTDEWNTGGAEITDWAFGLVTRERQPKQAFESVGQVFAQALPPPIETPKASVIVAAYNAAATLGECLASLKDLDYPDYETIVVDDGSTDATAQIAEQAGARVVRLDHRGLAAARNAGIEAASGDLIAFIDADARADSDWLYHLAEAIVRRGAAAAGGPNFPPEPAGSGAAAMASAPGIPREVRSGDDRLSQLCGCNMAVTRDALSRVGGFDPAFTSAGDDVDLSWRLAEADGLLAYAPGAVVIHERRARLDAYLAQQRGYGRGEGLLWRRYPLRGGGDDEMYGGSGAWLWSLLGGPRVYYGAFGRGLFQTVYPPAGGWWLMEVPLSIQWVGGAALLFALGSVNRLLLVLGVTGLIFSIAAAALSAIRTPLPHRFQTPIARLRLCLLYLLGPIVRSAARESVKWTMEADGAGGAAAAMSGAVMFAPESPDLGHTVDSADVLAATRRALVRRGLAVAVTDGFQSYDLEIIVPPAVRAPLNALKREGGRVALRWRVRVALRRPLVAAAVALVVLVAAGLTLGEAAGLMVFAAAAVGAVAMLRARRICAFVAAAAADAARELHASAAEATEEAA
jgi:GT2 family glycosyltransferase